MKKHILSLIFLFAIVWNGYSQTVQVCIKVNNVALPASKNAVLCQNDTAVLAATNCAATPETNVTYSWKNIDIAPYTDSLNKTIHATQPGRWVASIKNNTTTIVYTDTVFLNYPPAFDVSLNDAGILPACPLDSVQLIGTPSGPVVSYQWYLYDTTGTTFKLTGYTTNSYKFIKKNVYYFLEVKNANGCSEYDTSKLMPQSLAYVVDLGPKVGPDTITICEGIMVTLQTISPHVYYRADGTPGVPPSGYDYSYRLLNSSGNYSFTFTHSNLDVPPPYTTDPSVPTSVPVPGMNKYSLLLNAGFGYCSNSDTLYVIVQPLPDITYADTTLCYGASIIMNPVINAGAPITGWSWSPSTGLSATNSQTPTVSGLSGNQSYTITATNACGTGNDNVTVKYNPPINVNVSNDTTICQTPAGTANLSASVSGGTPGTSPPYLYQWSPAGTLSPPSSLTTTSTTANPIVTIPYSFTATDAYNCTNSKTVTVTVYAPPIATIASPQTINEDISTTLEASTAGNGGFNFVWKTDNDPTTITNSTSLFLEYHGPDTVRYVVIVTNPTNNCLNTDTVEIWSISNNTLMYVPNVFSPNAIDDQNKTLKVYSDNLLPDGFKFLIYNKWGNLMYETTDLMEIQSKGWDGGPMVEGVYTYLVVGKFKNGKDVKESSQYKGTFTLIK
ncbi:MAG TPA: gliding motility-associated C-terminal domain-containing protein [Cytophagaceae bacterium]|nr:gliding motility-associated C-terminal domain-containing protein [Cytophagaceae bacterium]